METIKFRAWFTKQQRMHVVESMEWIADGTAIRVYTEKYSNSGGTYSQWHEDTNGKTSLDGKTQIPSVHLMQYTGNLDKNNQEIYEGDLVADEYGRAYRVVFKGDCWRCEPVKDGAKNRWISRDLEVIGNVYEIEEQNN